MSVLERLTEGIISRDLEKEGAALLNKWRRTGLLEGIGNERNQHNMARLLENQAKELLREASTMGGTAPGDVEGFAAVAFPIVRRVFGGLIANDLVSVQPMSLPSGLIFFLDFTFNSARLDYATDESLYGGGAVASQITGGVSLTSSSAESSFYNLNNGYSSPTGSQDAGTTYTTFASGTFAGGETTATNIRADGTISQEKFDKFCRFDPDFISGTTQVWIGLLTTASTVLSQLNVDNLTTICVGSTSGPASGMQVKRLTQWSGSSPGKLWEAGDAKTDMLVYAVSLDGTIGTEIMTNLNATGQATSYAMVDNFQAGDAIGSVRGTTNWGLENDPNIPEIDIKVDSVAVTAITKKLKAKWTPELGQDLNAYHNIDAEVELTGILSEQIALEIDREIMEDLVKGASAGTYYWSRSPGMFLERNTGIEVGASSAAPDFTGTVSEWYETLIETINDVSAQIHRKTLRGGANFVVCGPEVANVLEFTSGFRASVTADDDRGTIGGVKVGSVSRKFDVYVDPYFPRNVILVGRKGSGFLESGYVYAPYVPLQVTPTIFGIEDFVPRKGVMTRYAKKMVRPDMYGLVIVRGLIGESGATS